MYDEFYVRNGWVGKNRIRNIICSTSETRNLPCLDQIGNRFLSDYSDGIDHMIKASN